MTPSIRHLAAVLAASATLGIGASSADPLAARPAAQRADWSPIGGTVQRIITRMRQSLSHAQMLAMDRATVERFITDDDRSVLANRYWTFRVDAPATVSIMRHTGQEEPPFWLKTRGFKLTPLKVRSQEYEYEVWQKQFPAGPVGLGINCFNRHRVHYFVSVGPQGGGRQPRVTDIVPALHGQSVMRKGASMYHDWSDLTLVDVPKELEGQVLLPTIRGRAREAHFVGGFRQTALPSTLRPSGVALTWPDDPKTSVAIQWRTSPAAREGWVEWKRAGDRSWSRTEASNVMVADHRILNDPEVRLHTATLAGLRPDTAYEYRIGPVPAGPIESFRTAPAAGTSVSFVWLSDTHSKADTARLLERALLIDPGIAFAAITGDLVGTGQFRDDWDLFFAHTEAFAKRRPIVPTMGNHDTIDGLGADLFLSHFALPRNGARTIAPERSYAFTYANTLFVILDCTEDIAAQTGWLEGVLRSSNARWKLALFHFPPYSTDEDYPDIRQEWCTLFDRYHVDFVLSGHVHQLERSHPVRGGKVVSDPADGTIYLMTVSVGQGPGVTPPPPWAIVKTAPIVPVCHVIQINDRGAHLRAIDAAGKTWDELNVTKR